MSGFMSGSGTGEGYPGGAGVPRGIPQAFTAIDAAMQHRTATSRFLEGIVMHMLDKDKQNPNSQLSEIHDIQFLLGRTLKETVQSYNRARSSNASSRAQDGRLGPSRVLFDKKSSAGNFSFSSDMLGVTSQNNFSTIRANVCVYKGKWQYELMLGTKGVMQVGWATMGCNFSQEKGVGDTPDSYAYDGNRQRKWNVATYKYGAMWQCGDIISCTLDLEQGIVEFFRNGKSLGHAFTNVKVGPGFAYFPAVSLALGETLTINYGSTPFRYPQEGFSPLEERPIDSLLKARCCVNWLKILVELSCNRSQFSNMARLEEHFGGGRRQACILLVAQHIAVHLGPLLATPYVVEDCLVPAIAQLAEISPPTQHQVSHGSYKGTTTRGVTLVKAHYLFDFLMASLEDHELFKCLENIIMCLLTGHKQAAENISFSGQKYNLRLLYVMLSHSRLRKYCLDCILFDKVRFPSFVNIKTVDEEGLSAVVPSVWWSSKDGSITQGDKEAYDKACKTIQGAVEEVEEIQVSILRLLLSVNDAVLYKDTSRALFLAKFRTFLKEQAPGSRALPSSTTAYTPLPVILCLFHRLLTIFNELWTASAGNSEITIPPRLFYDSSVNYFDTHRLGGLESYLLKNLKKDLTKALEGQESDTSQVISKIDNATAGASAMGDVDMCHNEPSTSGAMLGDAIVPGEPSIDGRVHRLNVTPGDMEGKPEHHSGNFKMVQNSLHQLLDGIILLYHIGAHKQLGKVAAQRDSMTENVSHVVEIDKKIRYCREKGVNPRMLEELQGSRLVFINKLEEQARQQAWVLAAVHSCEKYTHIVSLMKVILSTVKNASNEGDLFGFVPDFYIESLTEMSTALRLYFTTPPEDGKGTQSLLTSVGEFLALHFCDFRIVYADSKDSLIQALAGFVCHQTTLTALENMPQESRLQMVRNLLQPYENRAWAQNNWILVRFWKGCGFGFRYTKSPHMTNKFGPKPTHSDNPNFTQATAPCPSSIFRRHVRDVLVESPDVATPFLNSLLNQLNWAFSEFIGMLQEIQNASNRPERVFIDSRQLRICATCFDLALALLRVLEMIVNIAPQLFTDFSHSSAELLLSRLCQLLCQVLNRVSGSSGCFGYVVGLEIPGLETIHHYPILTAVTGILVTLVNHDLSLEYPKPQLATRILLNEPSFQINSVYQLLGDDESVKAKLNRKRSIEISSSSSSSSATPVGAEGSSSSAGDELQSMDCTLPSSARAKSPPTLNNLATARFSLRNYPDHVTSSELRQVEKVIAHLESCMKTRGEPASGTDEDALCTICYAYPASALFEPCQHLSCRACVTQHLMNRGDCFFCKTTIQVVKEQSTSTIIYQAQVPDNPTVSAP